MTQTVHELTLSDGRTLWTISRIVEHLAIGKATFTSYVSKGFAPAPAIELERTRLWDAEEVKAWHANRPGSPVPGAPKCKR